MFATIFSFEFKRWLKSWPFYVYLGIFFSIAFLLMATAVGVFDSKTVTVTSIAHMNSAISLNFMVEGVNRLLYFLFPAIIGASIYRDYKYEMHHVLYSYPFSKWSYLLAKFFSAFLVTFIISIFVGIGLYIATILPWANAEVLGPNILWNYVQVYLFTILPNMLLMGMIIFVVSTLTRSIYAGFIAVVVLMVFQGIVNSWASQLDSKIVAAILDPTGTAAIGYHTQYWTVEENNTLPIPLGKYFVYNRLLWLAVSTLFMVILGLVFKFSQHAPSFSLRKWKSKASEAQDKLTSMGRVALPDVSLNFSNKHNWSNVFCFTGFDLKYIIKNKLFLIMVGMGLLLMFLTASSATSYMGTEVYPVTRLMLDIPGSTFQLVIMVLTFLGAGLLIHRAEIANMNQLIDSTAVPNWVLFLSKFLALIMMQAILLLVIMVGGMIIQSYNGYYTFEIGLYLKRLLGLQWVWYIIWAGLAVAVQTFFKNYIVGFIVLLLFALFGDQISKLGVEQTIFFFNRLPSVYYTDMIGFSSNIPKFLVYVLYWLLFIGFVSGLSLLFWRRGMFSGLKERWAFAARRSKKIVLIPMILCLTGFVALGSYLYYDNVIKHTYYSAKEREIQRVDYERIYKKYEGMAQPRIVDVKIDMDIYPENRDFEARGEFLLKNKTNVPIDTLFMHYSHSYTREIEIENARETFADTVQSIKLYKMEPAMMPGEEILMSFTYKNKPNTVLRDNSPVEKNGTFINNMIFPSFGYSVNSEYSDTQLREKYGLPPKERMAEQTDSVARMNTYISRDADWITFEATVSTSADQIAIAPGYLQEEWVEGNRRYFHYKMDRKMLNFYAFNSGRYEVMRDKWNDINLEIYYHKGHEYNLDRMMKGMKNSLQYFTEEFSPYQHKQVRILEFPLTHGSFAQSFANTIPFSEGIGFIARVDVDADNKVDYPFAVIAHEVAHQWWAHQVIGANVQGATMLSESLAEYSALKVLEHEYGKGQMRKFLQEALNSYLRGRRFENKKEQPLMYNENQQYIHYNKGSLIFYTLSDYLGEKEFNGALSRYIGAVAFQEPPYTVAGELVDTIRAATPNSLQYLIKDMFETITLYDNYIDEVEVKELPSGKYEVNFTAYVSKYRSGDKGEKSYSDNGLDSLVYENDKKDINSLPLQDYIEIGIFAKADKSTKDKDERVLYLEKVKVDKIKNEFSIIVDEKPTEVGIDPYNKLIDRDSYDNRKSP